MHELTILTLKTSKPGKSELIGSVEADDFEVGAKRAKMGFRGANALRKLLGAGFGDRHFNIQVGDQLLVDCTIDRNDGGCTIGFMSKEAVLEIE